MNDIFDRKFLRRPTPAVIEKTKYSQGYAGHVPLPLGLGLVGRDVEHFYNSYFIFLNHVLFFIGYLFLVKR